MKQTQLVADQPKQAFYQNEGLGMKLISMLLLKINMKSLPTHARGFIYKFPFSESNTFYYVNT